MLDFKVACGPLSLEIIEAVYRLSHEEGFPLALICTKNQIDVGGGYVGPWTVREYRLVLDGMQKAYPKAVVSCCRDHLGPGFGKAVITDQDAIMHDFQKTLEADLNYRFDLIHLDFCRAQIGQQEKVDALISWARTIKEKNPDVGIEVGTDEIGEMRTYEDMAAEVSYILDSGITPDFYVVNTGSKTLCNRQVGVFNAKLTERMHGYLQDRGIKLKEHNADYLPTRDILLRRGRVDAVNIAPMLGYRQTQVMLQIVTSGNTEGLETARTTWAQAVGRTSYWQKWFPKDEAVSKHATFEDHVLAAGHYLYRGPEYRVLCSQLPPDWREEVIKTLMQDIYSYHAGLS